MKNPDIYKEEIDWRKVRQIISDKAGKQYSQTFIKEVWRKQKTSTIVKNILIELGLYQNEEKIKRT